MRSFPAEIGIEGLRTYWRHEGAKRSGAAQLSQVKRLARPDLGRRYRERLRLIWEIDPNRRARELERKRLDAMRRERERGRQPITPERAAARSRLAWQRRRERAAARGLATSADEIRALRLRLAMTQAGLAAEIGRTRSSIEHYETGENQAPPSVVRKLRVLMRDQEKMPAPSRRNTRTAPAAVVTIGSATTADALRATNTCPAGRLATSEHSADRVRCNGRDAVVIAAPHPLDRILRTTRPHDATAGAAAGAELDPIARHRPALVVSLRQPHQARPRPRASRLGRHRHDARG